eukprot:TRINITY_DN7794_c0_g2_i1.p1 TRINITY_DN7794_c0_g2~~TRINITY_DN7794_c0_g2_i1.p1  ORF type:complete len:626 (+),score=313.72 TRINITY_DN7794_c0_g2_i1:140-2017(+)
MASPYTSSEPIQVVAVKSFKEGLVGQLQTHADGAPRSPLFFRRKQQLKLIDYDNSTESGLGELEGRQGWFPASFIRPLRKDEAIEAAAGSSSTSSSSQGVPIPGSFSRSSSSVSTTFAQPKTMLSKQIASNFLKSQPFSETDVRQANELIKRANKAKNTEDFIRASNFKFQSLSLSRLPHLDQNSIPVIITSIISYLRDGYMDLENIFRASGTPAEVKLLRESFDKGEVVDVKTTITEPHSACVALKLFLRDLADPLLTRDLYPSFCTAAGIANEERKIQQMRDLLEMVPPQNFNVIKYLVEFLHQLTLRSEVNKLTVVNASRIFSQMFCRDQDLTIDKDELQRSCDVLELLISKYEVLFSESMLDTKDISNEKNRESKRRKQKDAVASFLKEERKKARKEKKEREKESKKRKGSKISSNESLQTVLSDSSPPGSSSNLSGILQGQGQGNGNGSSSSSSSSSSAAVASDDSMLFSPHPARRSRRNSDPSHPAGDIISSSPTSSHLESFLASRANGQQGSGSKIQQGSKIVPMASKGSNIRKDSSAVLSVPSALPKDISSDSPLPPSSSSSSSSSDLKSAPVSVPSSSSSSASSSLAPASPDDLWKKAFFALLAVFVLSHIIRSLL